MRWTPDRIEHLKALWSEGHSYTYIGRRMGITHNAVSGKVDRLGLSSRVSKQRKSTQAQRRWKGGSKSKRKAPAVPENIPNARSLPPERATEPDRPSPNSSPQGDPALSCNGEGRITDIENLTNHHCRWAIGDPQDSDFAYCGAPADLSAGRPYCDAHTRVSKGLHSQAGQEAIRGEARRKKREKVGRLNFISQGSLDHDEAGEAV